MNWKKDEYLASWPKAVPYPYAIARSREPVPNRSSVDWPQAQWAPLFLPPGSASVQPYRYPADGPIQSIVPKLNMIKPMKYPQHGPAGDIVATASIGAHGAHTFGDMADSLGDVYGGDAVTVDQSMKELEALIKSLKSKRRDAKKAYEKRFDLAVDKARRDLETRRKNRRTSVNDWEKRYEDRIRRFEKKLQDMKSSAERRAEAYQNLYKEDTLDPRGKEYTESVIRQLQFDRLEELFEGLQKRKNHLSRSDVQRSNSETRYIENAERWVAMEKALKRELGYGDLAFTNPEESDGMSTGIKVALAAVALGAAYVYFKK